MIVLVSFIVLLREVLVSIIFRMVHPYITRAIMSSHMVSRYVYCSYSCSGTVCMLHVHMNLTIVGII